MPLTRNGTEHKFCFPVAMWMTNTTDLKTINQLCPHVYHEFFNYFINSPYTAISRYYDTAGIRKKYHNIQTIELSSMNF